ncbi:MFS transporter [Streptomyces monashensis]|uniref:Major facilitator superfamily (MFS) profile domain-containing protein n=1 Tax=Streptomyces monashensis TaxID=1678012 RepID=A0A1S2QQA3_9ACTN|nr:MFS transporter [Streptomyces monashensis]OIK07783.1 hypothetical protein BIV23_02055 [Streptomyces monashensis]
MLLKNRPFEAESPRTPWLAWLTGPMRRLLVVGGVDWLGTGLMLAASAVYFTKIVGLSTRSVGTGLALAGVVVMFAAVPVGALADRFGTKRVLIAVYLMRSAATVGYLFVGQWWGLVVVATFRILGDQATGPLVQSLAAEIAEGSTRVRLMSLYRVVANVALTVSTSLAGLAIGVGTFRAFATLLVCNAVLFLATAAVLWHIPSDRPAKRAASSLSAKTFRDGRLLVLTVADCLLALWQPLLAIAMPLWVVDHTDAPKFMVGVLFAVNTVFCILLQVPAGKASSTTRSAARSYVTCAVLLVLSCGLFGAAGSTGGWATLALLVLALAATSVAEVLQVGASWTISYAIAPDALRSQYLSAFGLGRTASRNLLGPLLLTSVITMPGCRGWLVLCGVLLVVAAALHPLLRHVLLSPRQETVPTP